MPVEAVRLMNASDLMEAPPERTSRDILSDTIAESPFGAIGGWIDRAKAKTGEELGTGSYEPVTTKIGPITSEEQFMVTMNGYEDAGQAAQAVIESRAKAERQRRMSKDGMIESFIANTVAYGPMLGLEYAMYRGLGGTMAAKYLPQAVRHPISRDIVAAGSVEFSAEALRTALDPVDGIDEAIKNGAYATAFSGALIGGIELARVGVNRGANSFIDGMVDRAKGSGPRQAAAEMMPGYAGTGGKWRPTTLRDKQWDEIAESYGHEKGHVNAAKWRNGELEDGFKGQRFVVPKRQTSPVGEQILVVPRKQAKKMGFKIAPTSTKAMLQRTGDTGDWTLAGEGKNTAEINALREDQFPLSQAVDNFLAPVASQTIRSNRADMIEHYRRIDTEPAQGTVRERAAALTYSQRMDRIENTLRAEVDDLKAQAADTSIKAGKEASPEKAKELRRKADAQDQRASKADRDLNFWVKEGARSDWLWQGKGAEPTLQLFRATGQFPTWNIWGNKTLRQFPVMRQWSEAVERLSGTNGSMLPDPDRPTVHSVVGGQHMWNQKFEVYHTKMRDIYGALQGMEKGALTPAKLRMQRTYQAASRAKARLWKTSKSQESTQRMSWDEFQYTYQQAMIDNIELGQTHPNPHIQKAVVESIEFGQELEGAAKNANVFASAQSIQRSIDETNDALENISPELRKYETEYRKTIAGEDEAKLLARYKDTIQRQQALREKGTEDGPDWDSNGIELAIIRQEIDKNFFDELKSRGGKAMDADEKAALEEIQKRYDELALSRADGNIMSASRLEAEEVNEKFFEMQPLFKKLSTDTIWNWYEQKSRKLTDKRLRTIHLMINEEMASLRGELTRRGEGSRRYKQVEVQPKRTDEEAGKQEIIELRKQYDDLSAQVSALRKEAPSGQRERRPGDKYLEQLDKLQGEMWIIKHEVARILADFKPTFRDEIPEVKAPIERVWRSTKHFEVDPPSRLNERLNRKLKDLEDRQAQARTSGFSQHLARRFDSAKIDARIKEFKEILTKYFREHPERYEGDKNPRSTKPEDIEERVNESIARIHGENVYNDVVGQVQFDKAGRPLSNGALARRRLDIPSHLVRDFLEPYQIDIMATATKKIGGAIEMVRATGDQSGENMIQDLIDKSMAQGVPADTVAEMAKEIRALRDSVLGIDGLATDPMRWDTRLLRLARWHNVAAFMGRVPQVMVVDIGYATHIAGFKKLLQATNLNTQGISTKMGEILKKDAGLWLAGTEVNQMSRSASILNDPVGSMQAKTPIERGAQAAADATFFWTGASWFTDWIRRQSGLLTSHEILRLSGKVVDGSISNTDKARLRSFGLDDDMARKIDEEWKRIPEEDRIYQAQFGSGEIYMANMARWKDQQFASLVASKIRMELDNIVPQMNAGTRPKIMKNEWGRALLLYSSIGIHMTQTVNMRMLQRGPRNALAAAASMILAGYLVENMRKPDYISDDPEDALYGAVIISGVTGFTGDVFAKLSDSTGSSLGLQHLGIEPNPWSEGFNPLRLNPITSQLGEFGMSFMPGTEGDDRARAWKYMFWFNNMWQWNATYDAPNELREWAGPHLE